MIKTVGLSRQVDDALVYADLRRGDGPAKAVDLAEVHQGVVEVGDHGADVLAVRHRRTDLIEGLVAQQENLSDHGVTGCRGRAGTRDSTG